MNAVARQKFMLKLRTWVLVLVGIVAFAGFAYALIVHWDYYQLSQQERPFHDAHAMLKPSGSSGFPSGLIATLLILLNLGYLLRKRLIHFSFLGPLRMWMDLHVLTGFIGGGLILFHSALAPSSVLGTFAAGALLLTVITGVIGRTIYIQVPRSLQGRELELAQVREELEGCRAELEAAGMESDWLNLPPPGQPKPTSLIAGFHSMFTGYRERTAAYRVLKKRVLETDGLQTGKTLPLVRSFCIHAQWLSRYHELRALIASWRFFHRWLAVVMICVVACHIVVAVRYAGLDWSFWE